MIIIVMATAITVSSSPEFYSDNMYITSQNQPSSFQSLDLAAIWISPIICSQVVSTHHNKAKSEKFNDKPDFFRKANNLALYHNRQEI